MDQNTKSLPDSKLGPVDLGPTPNWWHLVHLNSNIALCGTLCVGPVFHGKAPSNAKACPDCYRIAGQPLP